MAKIFDALERFREDRKENEPEKIKPVDWATLMHYLPGTGKLDLTDSSIINDAGTIKRLLDNKWIFPDGTLTPAALKKFALINSDIKNLKRDPQEETDTKKKESKAKEQAAQPGKTTTADWDILMSYDRETGNLLQYELEDGGLDRRSRKILRDSDTVQRLMENNMILAGGWLTPEAKKQCEKLKLQMREQQTGRSTMLNKRGNQDARNQRPASYEVMKHMDSKYDRGMNGSRKT